MTDVKVLNRTKSEYTDVISKAKEIKSTRDAALLEFNDISADDVSRLNKIVPEKFNPVLFANDITAMGVGYGFVIKNLRVDTPKTQSRDTDVSANISQNYKTNTVTFSVTGTYAQFMRFLQNLELNLQLLDLTSITIQPGTGPKSGDIPMDFSLEMKTYSIQ